MTCLLTYWTVCCGTPCVVVMYIGVSQESVVSCRSFVDRPIATLLLPISSVVLCCVVHACAIITMTWLLLVTGGECWMLDAGCCGCCCCDAPCVLHIGASQLLLLAVSVSQHSPPVYIFPTSLCSLETMECVYMCICESMCVCF